MNLNQKDLPIKALPLYSPDGQRVFEMVKNLNPHDRSLDILGRRVARAITMHDAGFIREGQPLASFLLAGKPAAPFYRIVETVAKGWIGNPWGGVHPFVYVNCSAYHALNPYALSRLVGPLPADAFGRQPTPILGQLDYAHFAVSAAEPLKKISDWRKKFIAKHQQRITDFGVRIEQQFYRQLEQLVGRENERLLEEERKKRPLKSVVLFDAVDRGSIELAELIRAIIHGGNVAIFPDTVVGFSNTLVFLSVYSEKLEQTGIGMVQAQEQTPQGTYEFIRRNFLKDPATAKLVQDLAENVFIVGERTLETQTAQTVSRLEELARSCKEIGIAVSFTPAFAERFVRETLDPAIGTYTSARLESSISRHVLYHLSRLALADRLRRGMEIRFIPAAPAEKEFEAEPEIIREGREPVSKTSIQNLFKNQEETQLSLGELLKDPLIARLDEEAKELIKQCDKVARMQALD